MLHDSPIPVVDLFAGPGGLGEGFSACNNGKSFRIHVSAEKDPIARETLRLRAFYRLLLQENPEGLDDYYNFCNGLATEPFTSNTVKQWEMAGEEALCIELGTPEGNTKLDQVMQAFLKENLSKPWVLIGGPPCQAYSLVGRSRNKGNADYRPEEDNRHFLYKEYLRIIQEYQPSIFVMENVKGILSAKVNGRRIFDDILRDLSHPDKALGKEKGLSYRICSLVNGDVFLPDSDLKDIDSSSFIIKSEEYGIPQARHRVILLGIREDLFSSDAMVLQKSNPCGVKTTIGGLPRLRSKISRQPDNPAYWYQQLNDKLKKLANAAAQRNLEKDTELAEELKLVADELEATLPSGSRNGCRKTGSQGKTGVANLDQWLLDDRLKVWLNHETRSHMLEDLIRYCYAASFARIKGHSPKGHHEFNLPGLRPDHKNWETGKFSDRFRVQTAEGPSTTITSHISKDGHYFIHYEAQQCRSLTVREAARLQTFPDNYYFQGPRTQQFHQVGNAVPPLLAKQIADVVLAIIGPRWSVL